MQPQAALRFTIQSGLFVALFVALTMLLAFVARDYRKEWDVTRSARNSLAQPTLDVLRQLDGPVTVTAYAVTQDTRGNVHKSITERLRPYRRAKPDFEISFVDPREDPKRAEAAQLRTPTSSSSSIASAASTCRSGSSASRLSPTR